jgi:AraC-like DNA-binding protein
MQRDLFSAAARGEASDTLMVEERVIALLDRVLEATYGAAGRRPAAVGDEVDAVRAARLMIAERFREPLSLADVAVAVGLSRYRLCHVFRAATGTTLHAYREQLRLRAAPQALEAGCDDLTELALDLGYSSHSHFSSRFRRSFGLAPSRVRG